MKLAEALILRAHLQTKAEELKIRINNNITVQEGDSPSEDPVKLINMLQETMDEILTLMQKINRTNNVTILEDDMTLSDALAKRDIIFKKRAMLSDIARKASEKTDRYSNSEIKNISLIDVEKLQKKIDDISKESRVLDTKIQGKNWLVDLIES